ncbi:hypothetical protein D3Z38_02920 [Clostridiales bacterium]|nr:hypothetical protein [Clostridiales bacterium]
MSFVYTGLYKKQETREEETMASSKEFVEYVCDQLSGAGDITSKKMFGEYGLYCDRKFFATVENDQLYVKTTEEGQAFLEDPIVAEPHEGTQMFLIEELEDRTFLAELARRTCSGIKPGKLDYKKEYKDLYAPKTKPALVQVPEMTFIMVDGKGDPNTSQAYKTALELLYGLSYSIKMSKMGENPPAGYFEYVVPPLEGLWETGAGAQDGEVFQETGIGDKDQLVWTSMIRQPEFVTEQVFLQAKEQLAAKKPELDVSAARFAVWEEGLCVQAMHKGSYDEEPATIEKIHKFLETSDFVTDFSKERRHHEIYLSDPRRTAPEKLKTVLRFPVREK